MTKKCLYCYQPMAQTTNDFHEHCSLAFFGTKEAPTLPYSLNQMSTLAKDVVERSIAVPGVQPKLSLSITDGIVENQNRLTVVGALGGNYIFKPPSDTFPEMPENEHLTMRMAESFGIETVLSSLIRLQSGEISYITKRIDRQDDGEKIHMLDMFQITEANDKYRSSMEKVGKALDNYSSNTLFDKLRFFELTLFSFLTGNNDMHLKNFSMIIENEQWILSPAYDLLNVNLANPADNEELALSLEGKRRKLKRYHFERFGNYLDLNSKQINSAFNRLVKYKPDAFNWIQRSFLTQESKEKYKILLDERYALLK